MAKIPIWLNLTVAIVVSTVIFRWILFLASHYLELWTMLLRECNPMNWEDNFKEAFSSFDPTCILGAMGPFGQSLLLVLDSHGKLDQALGKIGDGIIDIAKDVENGAPKMKEITML